MDDLLVEFLTETNEGLEELDADLVKLEKSPNDKDLLSKIFRIMHTIKGTCGFLGLPRLELVAHNGENVMSLFRDGTLEVTPEYVTLIFESLDRVRLILAGLESAGEEPQGDDSALIARLSAVTDEGSDGEDSGEEIEFEPVMVGQQAATEDASDSEEKKNDQNDSGAETINTEQPETTGAEKLQIVQEVEDVGSPEIVKESAVANQSLRVNVDVLENLMTLVSELVLTRNQLLQILRRHNESDFATPLQRLNHVVSDLQEGVMQTRMQPIGNAWAKLPRIIRDLSIESGKKIELEMIGQDTELDRQVLELIKDPLTHMVRNSADHGIETPEERIAAGKPEKGTITLNSYHEGGHIIIAISDDGRGLSTEAIKKKVIVNNLATEEELESMSDLQIQQFIFKPGFSTAAEVTSVSGRGVGMDVAITNVEKIGGSIELNSVEGKGTNFLIKIPLTLAIVSALIVESAKERFAIPQLVVRELVMVSGGGDNRIETIKGTPVFRLRDQLLPLVSLEDVLEIRQDVVVTEDVLAASNDLEEEHQVAVEEEVVGDVADLDSESDKTTTMVETKPASVERVLQGSAGGNQYIVVTQVGAYSFGIIVDRVFDTEEIVIKPVANILKGIEMFSGNTILGDGAVIMILDPVGIAKASGEISTSDMTEASESEEDTVSGNDTTSLLLFIAGSGAPKAVPLELISRLEEIKMKDIEWADETMVVQYRDKLMPLVLFDQDTDLKEETHKPVLVFSDENHSMGLIVDKIIDITESHIDIQMGGRDGMVGSAIIEGHATDVVEVSFYLKAVDPNWFGDDGEFKDHDNELTAANDEKGKHRVLLVEDSPFFRNMITPLLTVAGYEVTVAENAIKALELCDEGIEFDLIVSDIEMPEMNGFEFAKKIKADSPWKDVPLVALSSHATAKDKKRGLKAGFGEYVVKFDRETLLSTLSQAITSHGEVS